MSKLKYKIEELKNNLVLLKYKKKMNLFCIDERLMVLLINDKKQNGKDILNIISKSKNISDFKNNIVEYFKMNPKSIYDKSFLLGNVTNNYTYFTDYKNIKIDNIDNFKDNQDNKIIIDKIRNYLYEYVMSDNSIKNRFLINNDGSYDYTIDLKEEDVLKYFDEIINNEVSSNFKIYSKDTIYNNINSLIFKIFNCYSKEDLLNNFSFVKYDLKDINNKDTIDVRKETYSRLKDLTIDEKNKINNLDKLKEKLEGIGNEQATKLLKEIEKLDSKEIIDNINDIYLEFEMINRENIIENLYQPKSSVVITDFRDLRTQLLHIFIRRPGKLLDKVKNDIKLKIISDRIDKNNKSSDLTREEELIYQKRLKLLEKEFDASVVNYSFPSNHSIYSDQNGYINYKADTQNQISAAIYSSKYFLNNFKPMIGIGFNQDSLETEAIVLSSKKHITSNTGLNNLELNDDFLDTSATLDEMIKNDGKGEVVLFRRNIDYDTKASYVFVAITDYEKDKEILNEATNLANKNKLKLVVYDLGKIKNSYDNYLNIEAKYDNIEKTR